MSDLAGELQYQLSNADPDTRPVRDLVENPVSIAYLAVLAVFVGFLAWLALGDARATARRQEGYAFMEQEAERMRSEGMEQEAAVLEAEVADMRAGKGAGTLAGEGTETAPSGSREDEEGNRFARRQGKLSEKRRRRRAKRKRGG